MSIETFPRDTFTIAGDVREVLTRTFSLLERGWCRFTLKRHDWKGRTTCYCLDGAVAEACGIEIKEDNFSAATYREINDHDLFRRCIRALGFQSDSQAFEWNDRQPDVMPVLTRIKLAIDGKIAPWVPA